MMGTQVLGVQNQVRIVKFRWEGGELIDAPTKHFSVFLRPVLEEVRMGGVRQERMVEWQLSLREWREEAVDGLFEFWSQAPYNSPWCWQFPSVEWGAFTPGRWSRLAGDSPVAGSRTAQVAEVGTEPDWNLP